MNGATHGYSQPRRGRSFRFLSLVIGDAWDAANGDPDVSPSTIRTFIV